MNVLERAGSALVRPVRQTTGFARWILLTGLLITVLFVIMAIFAPMIAPYGFAQQSADGVDFLKLQPPGGSHLMGTNDLFFDVWSRVVWGARTAVLVVILAVFLSLVIGVPLGLVSGYVGGWLDRILVLIMDALFAIPSLLLAIVVGFLLTNVAGGSVVTAGLAITVIFIPQYFRVVRGTTLSAREATYVEAARAIGAPRRTIIARYLFSNVIHSVPVIATINAAEAISTLAALGFLGLGIQPKEAAEWGFDIKRALDDTASGIWWTGVFPGLAILLLVVGLTLVGEGLNETINPTLRKRRLTPFVLPPRTSVREGAKGEKE